MLKSNDKEEMEHYLAINTIRKSDNQIPNHYRKNLQMDKLDKGNIKISNDIENEFKKLIDSYDHIFSRSSSNIGCYNGVLTYYRELANSIKES